MRKLVYLRNVVTLKLDETRCSGCGMCLQVCPHGVLAKQNGTVEIVAQDACMECGACAKNCPTAALSVKTGVGCASAVINYALGRNSSSCCCIIEPDAEAPNQAKKQSSGCC